MISYLIGAICVSFVALAVAFVIAGDKLYGRLGRVRKFNALSRVLQRALISGSKFGKQPLSVLVAAQKPLFDLRANGETTLERFLHYPFGDVVEIAYVHDRRQRTFVRELKGYCAILSLLFFIALGNFARQRQWEVSALDLLHDIGEKPFEFVGLLEVIMIGFIVFRLFVEIRDLAELLDVPEEEAA